MLPHQLQMIKCNQIFQSRISSRVLPGVANSNLFMLKHHHFWGITSNSIFKEHGRMQVEVRRMKGSRIRKLNWRRTEKGINFIYGYACTEVMKLSTQISCGSLKSLHTGKSTLATQPSHPHANPETAAQPVARAGTHCKAGQKGDAGFCTGMWNMHTWGCTAVMQWNVSSTERAVKSILFPGECFFWSCKHPHSISKVKRVYKSNWEFYLSLAKYFNYFVSSIYWGTLNSTYNVHTQLYSTICVVIHSQLCYSWRA